MNQNYENYCLRMGIGRNVPLGRGPLPLYESFPAPPFPSLLILGSRRQSLGSPMSKLFSNILFALVLLFGGFCCAILNEGKINRNINGIITLTTML